MLMKQISCGNAAGFWEGRRNEAQEELVDHDTGLEGAQDADAKGGLQPDGRIRWFVVQLGEREKNPE